MQMGARRPRGLAIDTAGLPSSSVYCEGRKGHPAPPYRVNSISGFIGLYGPDGCVRYGRSPSFASNFRSPLLNMNPNDLAASKTEDSSKTLIGTPDHLMSSRPIADLHSRTFFVTVLHVKCSTTK
ncbi:hypothetical protein EVAR_103936_1 [Eumeta japonica]|uniref:Uncharacterized protein n=1 Tax=Eumeta variegata TaxID=151549 RepID=A0A4C1YH39_EUMVA|nr:hypothetical protein EVAR_103936_1 [Eumeta japonica]